jgi:RHS repeat-associated protein
MIRVFHKYICSDNCSFLVVTGQRSEETGLGSLYDYNARFYSPLLGRFLQPDTLVPEPGNPQALNRPYRPPPSTARNAPPPPSRAPP